MDTAISNGILLIPLEWQVIRCVDLSDSLAVERCRVPPTSAHRGYPRVAEPFFDGTTIGDKSHVLELLLSGNRPLKVIQLLRFQFDLKRLANRANIKKVDDVNLSFSNITATITRQHDEHHE